MVVCHVPHRVGQGRVRAAAVEVVGVAEGEGAVDVLGGREDRVAGAPGAGAAGGRGVDEAWVRQGLVGVAEVESGGGGGAEVRVEVAAQVLLDDEEKARETGEGAVVEGVVEKGFAAGADRGELLEAAEACGAAGREDDEGEGGGGGGHGWFLQGGSELALPARCLRRRQDTRRFRYTAARRGVTCSEISRPASISARRSSQVFWRFNHSCGVVPK